ncbi:hypothetical protein L198_02739 [Cryptococcus wingfieldii CBS 7118]|uniref:Uncharacterized protein n=1 Tax=Cryptococcus wingfieldii CBS 7118 TaxID=1295528 RepID=A0A1E3JMC0_9TREE|nr:hypothetical protein L198_02739 [Cryptococcus wingfieldii CBS 7118]ODO02008.1 hypothetical protein L198_02739 [Cryptococcus wingfieldii CBS 7118]
MSNTFHSIRFALKATTISSLLILGHVLLTTAALAPYGHHHHEHHGHHDRHSHDHIHLHHAHHSSRETHSTQLAYHRALCILSALIFLTLLWFTFALLEGCDLNTTRSPPPPLLPQAIKAREDETPMVFMLTAVEVICGAVTGGAWLGNVHDRSGHSHFLPHFSLFQGSLQVAITLREIRPDDEILDIIPITYNIAFNAILLLNFHTFWSICAHARNVGVREVCRRSFWLGRIGWWEERVELD